MKHEVEQDSGHVTEDLDTAKLAAEPDSAELRRFAALGDAPERSPARRLAPGTRVGASFDIVEVVGEGGMGVVYRAIDVRLGRHVALKLHHAPSQGTERLLREATSMAQLSHPNVATVHEIGTHEGMLFIAMEFVDGTTARRWATAEGRSASEVIALYHQAGQGLAAVHAAGLIHRDFKPENVLVDADGVPRVADFGLARAQGNVTLAESPDLPFGSASAEPLTVTGTVLGTPAYMALEQIDGREVDAAADQFAFAISLFEALYGRRPFPEASMPMRTRAIQEGRFELPARPRIPARVRRVLRRALAAEPHQRFASMDDLLAALGPDPRAGRRRMGLVGVASAISAAGLVAITLAEDPDDIVERCAAATDGIEHGWDRRRSEVEQAFGQFDQPWVRRTLGVASTSLDAHQQGLHEGLMQACEARARASMSPDDLDRRDECLRRVGERADAVVDLLTTIDLPIAANAPQMVAGLPQAAPCADPVHLAATIDSLDPALLASHQDAHAHYARAIAHYHAGQGAEARADVRQARDAVASQDSLAFAAPILLLDGALMNREGKRAEAEANYEQAFFAARRVGDWTATTLAATRLVSVLVDDPERWNEAELWSKIAISEAQLHDAGGVYEVQARTQAARVDQERGHYQQALHKHQDTIALLEHSGASPFEQSNVWTEIGTVVDQLGEHAQALEYYRRGLETVESVFGSDHPALVPDLNNIALTHAALGHAKEAMDAMDRALPIVRANIGPQSLTMSHNLLNAGVAYATGDQFEEATELYRESLRILEERLGADHAMTATIHTSLSVALKALGKDQEAVEHARQAVERSEQAMGAEHPETANVLSNLADAMMPQDPQGARRHSDRAIEILRHHAPSSSEMTVARIVNGKIHLALGLHDNAADVLGPVLVTFADTGQRGMHLAQAQHFLGMALLAGADPERGAQLLEASAGEYDSLGERYADDARAVRAILSGLRADP
ncbi:MAG: serine/threonine-protein kinase [Myxococcota bacterium]